jgi:hypothetical protein
VATLLPGLSVAQVPLIQQVSPPAVAPGASGVTLTVNGADFASDAVVHARIAGVDNALTTTVVSGAQLTATFTAPNPAAPVYITVVNVKAARTSNAVPIAITTAGAVAFGNLNIKVGALPQAVALGDFNNDGNLDMAIVNSTDNNVSILLSNGDGTFTGPAGSALPAGTPPGPPSPTFGVGHNPLGLAVGDFNNDGKLDLAVVNQNDNTVSILLGNGDGTFQPQTTVSSNGTTPVSVATADFNADGNLDLAVVNQTDSGCSDSNGSVSVLTGDGTGAFPTVLRHICVGILPTSVVVGDFAGFGLPDLVVVNQGGGNASCAPANGTVTFASAVLIDFGPFFDSARSYCAGKGPSAAAVGDFNGDGVLDVAVTNFSSNQVSALPGSGSGTGFNFLTPDSFATGTLGPNSITVGDFNGDGVLDLAAAAEGSSQISILLGDGSGNFSPAAGSPFSTTSATGGRGPASLVAADFNGDGRLDVATAESIDNLVTVMLQSPAIQFSPPSLSFGNQPENTTSAAKTVTVTNVGSSPLTIETIDITGLNPTAFHQTNDCPIDPMTLGTGAFCTVSVTFTPGTIGPLSAAVTVTQKNGVAENVSLTGSGIAPAISFSPPTVTFGATLVGTPNPTPQMVTVSNIGAFDTTIQTISITGTNASDFLPITADTCSGQKLTAGTGTCTITVSFTPAAGGLRTAQINVPFLIAGGNLTTQTVALSGEGAAPAVNFAPTPLTFNNQLKNTTSAPSTVTLLNDGTYALTMNSVSASGDFAIQSNGCTGTLAVNTSCTVAVTFTPTAVGTRNGTLTFTDNNNAIPSSQQTVSLVGTGAAPIVSLAIAPQTFGNQQVGTTSAPSTVTLSNLGNWPLTINSIVKGGANPGDFAIQSNTCLPPGTVAASASCTVTVTFTPAAAGPRSATLVFTDNNNAAPDPPGVTQTVSLTGTGTAPMVSLLGLSAGNNLVFSGVPIGTTSAPLSFMISNAGTAPLIITSIVSSDPSEFSESDSCGMKPATLAANANCTITLTFTPAATGLRSATLTITDNNGGSPTTITTQTVGLSGTGTDFSISVAPASQTVSPGKFASYTLTLTPISGFTGTVTLGCSVSPAEPKTTCTNPISVTVSSPNTMFISASAKNSSKGTFTLNFFATFNATPPATGTLSHSTSASLTVK